MLKASVRATKDAAGVVRGSGPLCVVCYMSEPRRITPATDVDHVDGNPRHNRPENLRPLCHSCHSRRTATDQSFGRGGAA